MTPPQRHRTPVLTAALGTALASATLAVCFAGAAGAQSAQTNKTPDISGLTPRVTTLEPRVTTLKPRVVPLKPRVVPLKPRVVALAPRVLDVAPKQTTPHTFSVDSDVLFAFDSSTLSPDTQAVLLSVVHELQTSQPGTVTIDGYTDSIGTDAFNLTLSQQRAAAVQSFLGSHVTNAGLTYSSDGFGEADPVAPNTLPNGDDNPAGRQQNRRVVIAYKPS